MITTIRRVYLIVFTLLLFTLSNAQDLRTFNQNSSRSNNAKGLSISFSPAYSSSINNDKDSLLFRGNGGGFRVGADYFLGKAGLSFVSGFGSSSPDNAAINNFLKSASVPPDQMIVTKSNQQNIYLLLGPSVRFGKAVQLYAHAKGGLFINNGGLVSIQQRGAVRAAYRNESTGKSIYPGFQTGLGFQYKGRSENWSFGLGADYMSTQTEVTNYDARRGGGIEGLKLSQNIKDVVAGISIRYNITSPRDHASGQSTGRRVLPTVNKREINSGDASSSLSTGKTYQPGKPVYGNITSEESNKGNCGPVTIKTTNADGMTEEMTFSCPDDAANYAGKMKIDGGMPNRISMNVTTPKQTQGSTFGEKTYVIPHVLEQKGIVSGRLTWPSSGQALGIVTNKTIGTTRGGSLTMNSQTSSTRQTPKSSFGTLVRLSARESGSGLATGKRSREKGSGLATGRRQYEPFFAEGNGDVCNPCLATAKMSSANNNPLYVDKGLSGTNPLYEGNKRTADNTDDDCDGISDIDVFLVDQDSKTIISKTKTERCGDFFFANVPDGNYVVKVSGSYISKKGYDVYLKSKTDLMGEVLQSGDGVQLLINSGKDDEGMAQKAGISTSRSNLRTKSISIIEADLDGDGEFESLRATCSFSDGSSRDVTNDVTAKKVNKIDAFTIKQGVMKINSGATSASAIHLTGITIAKGDPDGNAAINTSHSNIKNLRATATFSDGSTQDITEALVMNTTHANVKQYNIVVADLDGDGFAESVKITKSRSNIQNNRIVADLNDDSPAEAIVKTKTKSNQSNDKFVSNKQDDEIWSPRSNIKMLNVASADVDGDGVAEMILGGALPGGNVISSAMRPGSPIKGISVKGGRNPGGSIGATDRTTNESGQFEFPDLEPGDYTFTVEQKIVIEDETPVTVGNRTSGIDYNSSRSNKTSSITTTDPGGDNDTFENRSKVQDHNSSRSNKSSSVVADDPNNNDVTGKKGDVKLTASQNSQSLRTIGPDMEPDVYWITSKGSMTNTSVMKTRNNNTVRSNRTDNALIENFDNNNSNGSNTSPVRWMAPESMKAAINTSHSNIKNLRLSLDDLDKQLSADQTNAKSIVNTSRSNIKNQRAAINDLEETLDNLQTIDKDDAMNELDQKMAAMNMQFLALQESLARLGQQYNTISNVLKTRHDIAMNSIRNMK